jgi:hypothetical protein
LHKVSKQKLVKGIKAVLAGVVLLPFLYSGHDRPSQLEQVLQRGSLIVLTRNGASSYYLGPDGPTGPEYALAKEFSDYLGVGLEISVAGAFNQLFGLLARRQGNLIAANLTRTPGRELDLNFGPDYRETSTFVVYRRGQPRPQAPEDLLGLKTMVIAGSSYEEALIAAKRQYPELEWETRSDVGIEGRMTAWWKKPGLSCCKPGIRAACRQSMTPSMHPGRAWTGPECSSFSNRSGSACPLCWPCSSKLLRTRTWTGACWQPWLTRSHIGNPMLRPTPACAVS